MITVELIKENINNENRPCAIIRNGALDLYEVHYMVSHYKAFAQVKYIDDIVTYKSVVDSKIDSTDKVNISLDELNIKRLEIACELIKEKYEEQVEEMKALFM